MFRQKQLLEAAEEFVEFVGGVEIGFEFTGAEAVAQVIKATGEKIDRGGENFPVGENDVTPRGIWAAREAQRVAQAGAG